MQHHSLSDLLYKWPFWLLSLSTIIESLWPCLDNIQLGTTNTNAAMNYRELLLINNTFQKRNKLFR